ncbi:TraB/GumN family protein [Rhodanobacter sp. L36]|uniref:TraB/GumN family protein n=1 Tax=Rhodanobacter sp. L36 TaxID=1747221 RepID=UPI00131EB94C|nr:TraB/GumN family protein [Rhodanobacter sp. L36]
MRLVLASIALSLSLPGFVHAQVSASTVPTPDQITNLEATTVSGVMPGPGLWRVSKGDHVMWVLGTLSPLPQRMQWESRDLEDAISHSQQVLLSPTIKPKVDVGFFGKLFLLPSAYSARKNDNGATLQQVLPAPTYARWLVLKQKYIGKDNGVERWRPIFAAQQLYRKAIRANDLSSSGGVQANIDALAKKYGINETPTTYEVVIEHPHDAIKTFKSSGIDDVGCFGRTLDSIEHDMPAITARANAWATGDLQALRTLPHSDRFGTCVNAITGAEFARKLGFADAPQKLEALWINAARVALRDNKQTFAMLPIDQLLTADGYLAKLKAQGYQVDAPEEDTDTDAGSTP